jgi:hypothetical protein
MRGSRQGFPASSSSPIRYRPAETKEGQMSMLSTRNALVGWAVIKLGKQATKTKAKQATKTKKSRATPAEDGGQTTGRRKVVPAVAVAVASAGGVLLFWRKRSRGASAEGDESE